MKKLLLLAITCLISHSIYAQSIVSIAAAANVRDAMQQIKSLFTKENPDIVININYGASGTLVQQIINGAEYDLFFSADETYPKKLQNSGLTSGDVKPYACGKLLMYSRLIDISEIGLKAFTLNKSHKIAVANPNAAPYGLRAVEMFKEIGIYDQIKSKIIYGENIGATAQYLFSANADLGIIALSQYKSPTAQNDGYIFEIPSDLYSPIIQSCVVIKQKKSDADAVKFRDFVLSKEAASIWEKYGYDVVK